MYNTPFTIHCGTHQEQGDDHRQRSRQPTSRSSRHHDYAPFLAAVLSTSGGLALAGDLDRYFRAYDVETGQVLCKAAMRSFALPDKKRP